MAYNITLSNGTHLVTIDDYTVDNSTSLTLFGRGVANYGAQTSNNLVHLLENGSNPLAPESPLAGQLWYNSITKAMSMWDGTAWQSVSTANHGSNQTITINGDASGSGSTSITLTLNPPPGLVGGGTAEKITYNAKGQVIAGTNLNSADIATAINGLLTINGTIRSTNFTLNSGQGGKITFSDGTTQSSAAASVPFTPVQQGGGAGMGNNKIYLGWDGSALRVQVDSSYNRFIPLSQTFPQLMLPATSTNQIGAQIILSGALLQPVNIGGTNYGQSQGENIVIDCFGRQDVGNQWRVYRQNAPIQYVLSYNVDNGILTANNMTTSLYDINGSLANLFSRMGTAEGRFGGYVPLSGSASCSGGLGTWNGSFAGITGAFANIFASSALIAPTVYCQQSTGTAYSAKYSDLAERYESDLEYSIGTLVKIGGEKEITQTVEYCDSDIFGVISESPALLMNSHAGSDKTHPMVGLIGRLRVRVTGQVKKGDTLVSSVVPGVACSIGKLNRGGVEALDFVFAKIGKALEDKSSDEEGLILAFIGKN